MYQKVLLLVFTLQNFHLLTKQSAFGDDISFYSWDESGQRFGSAAKRVEMTPLVWRDGARGMCEKMYTRSKYAACQGKKDFYDIIVYTENYYHVLPSAKNQERAPVNHTIKYPKYGWHGVTLSYISMEYNVVGGSGWTTLLSGGVGKTSALISLSSYGCLGFGYRIRYYRQSNRSRKGQ